MTITENWGETTTAWQLHDNKHLNEFTMYTYKHVKVILHILTCKFYTSSCRFHPHDLMSSRKVDLHDEIHPVSLPCTTSCCPAGLTCAMFGLEFIHSWGIGSTGRMRSFRSNLRVLRLRLRLDRPSSCLPNVATTEGKRKSIMNAIQSLSIL